jgi:putative ABC transport system substrate-binding protein
MPKTIARRRVILAAAAGILSPFVAYAQQPKKIPLVGVLHPGFAPPSPPSSAVTALQRGLRDLGYVEGQNVLVEYRYAGGKPELLPARAAELVKLKPDVLVAISTASINAAKAADGSIPIVATDNQADPVRSGLVKSLAKPGGNVTGLFLDFGGVMGKMLELLAESVPGTRRVAVLWDTAIGRFHLDALAVSAKKKSISLEVAEMRDGNQLDAVLAEAAKRKPHALLQLPSPIVYQFSARIAKFTQAHRLPSISIFRPFPEAGGLMSYGPDQTAFFSRLAPLVDKILKGARAGDLPIERPTTFEFVVNRKTAAALGLKIPQLVLLQVTKVIE